MSKIMALDLGDQWVGIALTDESCLIARPLTTVQTSELTAFLKNIITQETLQCIIVGHPRTMAGRESEQTRKIITQKENLEKEFTSIPFLLWDERLSSQRAQTLGPQKNKEEKLRSHARAAAFILDSYISYLQTTKGNSNDY
ncbi:Holliday junction resolvase RuvX [Candidatus Dependentiae bacterium]|nr:Holliday junction resolvase RuvX [Candidatus Dependentiae bacterium]